MEEHGVRGGEEKVNCEAGRVEGPCKEGSGRDCGGGMEGRVERTGTIYIYSI